MKYKLSIFITFLLIKIVFQIDVTNYELYLFAKYINDITGVYNQISDNFYMSQVPPGKKTFSGLCSYCDLAIGGFAKYNNCYITSNNNSYFKMLKGRNSSHFELINNHIKYFIIDRERYYYLNDFYYYEIKVQFDLPFKLPPFCNTNNDIEVKYITQDVKILINSENNNIGKLNEGIKNFASPQSVKINLIKNSNNELKGTIIIGETEIINEGTATLNFDDKEDNYYEKKPDKFDGYEEYIDFYINNINNDNEISNLSTLKLVVCGQGCDCDINNYQKCDRCLNGYYFKGEKASNCTLESDFLSEYPNNVGYYKDEPNTIYRKCGEMCKSCEKGYESETKHHCKQCKEGYDYFVIKDFGLNCYNKKCNIQNTNYREIENTHECIETKCNSIYKYEYNGEKCFSKCPENTIIIDYPLKKNCVDQCENEFKYHDLSANKCYNTSCYDNNVYEKEDNHLQCVSSCKDELKYYFLDTDAQVARCLTSCIEPKKFHDTDNSFCVEKCPYSKRYYKNDFICISECPVDYFIQFETNECIHDCGDNFIIINIRTCFEKCPDGYPLYLSSTKECVIDCTTELPFKYNDHCITDCKNTEKKFIGFRNECIEDCSSASLVYYDQMI